jgi:hypothetical protein
MGKVRSRMPELESLEEFLLMSGLLPGTGAPVVLPEVAITPLLVLVRLNGATHGTYTRHHGPLDVSKFVYTFKTSGDFQQYGSATVTGSVHTPGFIKMGRAGGTLHLRFATGTLSLKLTGLILTKPAELPADFNLQVSKGTGRFRGAAGNGSLFLHVTPIVSSATAGNTGKVTLTFRAILVPVDLAGGSRA